MTLSSQSANVLISSNGKNSFLNPGERQICTNFPAAIAIRVPLGENFAAAIEYLNVMRWRTARRGRLMRWQRELSSMTRRREPSGEAAMIWTLAEDWVGRVRVWDLIRSVTEMRLPTADMR